MYKQVYAKAKYTVDTATEVDDSTFGVKVTVEPLDVFDRVAEALWGATPRRPRRSSLQPGRGLHDR